MTMNLNAPGMHELHDLLDQLDLSRLPRHVAMIMDGNGRWAKARGLDRSAGHYEGVKSVRRATELSSDLGIDYLTLYAFSTENWHRPKHEVDILMHLIGMAIEQETPDLVKNNVHLHLIGDIDRMPDEAWQRLHACEVATADCSGLTLTLALSYSGRRELLHAARQMAREVAAGRLDPNDISEQTIARHLYTEGMPDPDLLIRTGGEKRVSNFLLWQIAYSELAFTPTLWPDFDKRAYLQMLIDFQGRERRFGMTGDQVKHLPDSAHDPSTLHH